MAILFNDRFCFTIVIVKSSFQDSYKADLMISLGTNTDKNFSNGPGIWLTGICLNRILRKLTAAQLAVWILVSEFSH